MFMKYLNLKDYQQQKPYAIAALQISHNKP